MSKQLIIAEKPSVAQDIARALGGFTKEKDYFESDEYVLSSAVGHLLELAVPEEYEVKRGKWTFAHLPVIPPRFALKPIEKTDDRLKLLTRLIKRKDVTGLINACDAGREGELIFSFIVQHAKTDKPISRLWLQSMTAGAIRDGFAQLRSAQEVEGLRSAAVCRAESDWLIGINGTRAMTAFNSKTGGFHLTTVGRVQTPTLAIVVEREEKIRRFKPRDYWELEATFGCKAGRYVGRWFDESFRKPEGDEHATAFRLWDRARADAIKAKCDGKPGIASEESKPSTQLSPLLFDLTSLQRDANGRFGFSARVTLQIAQALYEKHKALTYPRTDARALPEDYVGTVKDVLHALPDDYAPFAGEIMKQGWVRPNKRIFNNAKISDHFAIIPTGTVPKSLSEAEQKIYDLVTRRFLAVFYPAAEYRITTRITRVENEAFKTEGKVLVNPGWLAVYGKEAAKADDEGGAQLVAVEQNERVATEDILVKALVTKPPARYNEATLLSAMEGAGKMVDDEELRAAMGERGLGTPATRAQIIEGLIAEQYLHREGRELIPSAKAFSLITLLKGLDVSSLTSPELTGEWEHKLAQMERGQLSRPEFMREIAEMAREMVERAKRYESDTVPGDFATLSAPCPKCGGVVRENYKKFACQACDWSAWKIVAGRQFEIHEIETLLRERRVGPLTGFRSKMGRLFNAEIRLNDEQQPEFDFGQPKDDGEGAEPVDFSAQEPLGPCPKCGARVFEHGMAYVCEKSVGPEKSCDFRSGKVILQQPVEREQMVKLLADGRTDLLKGFVSTRTRRKFSAFLVRGGDGKVGFEFEAKTPKAGAKGKTAAAADDEKPPVAATATAKPARAPARKRSSAA
ncbi:DNA topoisomerase III [Aromatoleum aromaticum EbN1]|uniref:DNA topoisomerase n=1 Tax=Aromatoleum aromaticum (strain DSM 19018 / LMG 30748 / EbN1) TaxID=76114 RepID=Q5P4H1_AROAE|nr:DNA topoisomerase III [Aromatoleum aromaticum]CAI07792.1 DNA topoisomerase III [Aromatoleum aromaticum EbN1]